MIRAARAVDRLDRDGRTLLLFEESFVELSPLGAAVWEFAAQPRTHAAIVGHLVATFGPPPGGTSGSVVDDLLDGLVASGALTRDEGPAVRDTAGGRDART